MVEAKEKLIVLVLIGFFFATCVYLNTTNEINKSLVRIIDRLERMTATTEIFKEIKIDLDNLKGLVENITDPSVEDWAIQSPAPFEIFSSVRYAKILKDQQEMLKLANKHTPLRKKLDILTNFNVSFDDREGNLLTVNSYTNSLILSGSGSQSLVLHNLETHKSQVFRSGSAIYAGAVSKEKDLAVIAEGSSIAYIDLITFNHTSTTKGHSHWILTMVISEDSRILITAGCDKAIKIWSLDSLSYKFSLQGHKSDIWSLALAKSSEFLLSGSHNGILCMWSLSKRSLLKEFNITTSSLYSLSLFTNNTLLAIGCGDGYIRFLDLLSSSFTQIPHKGLVRSVLLIENDNFLLSLAGSSVRKWNLSDFSLIFELQHNTKLHSLTVTADLKHITCGDSENRLWVWDYFTGELKWVFGGTKSKILKVEVSEDLSWLIIAEEGLVRILRAEDLKQVRIIRTIQEANSWNFTDFSEFYHYLY